MVIINQAMAKRFWPKGDPLNDRLIIGKGVGPEFEEPARQIVGVVADSRDNGLNRNPPAMMYVPAAQVTDGVTALNRRIGPLTWVVRTRVPPYSLSQPIQTALREASGGLPVARIRTMDEVVALSTARQDFNMLLLTVFAGAALLLAAIGIYGLMAYSVAQRTQEIGIRMALGAETADVRRMVVFQGMTLALIGVGVGIAAAFGLSRLIASFLFGVKAWDPAVFVIVPRAAQRGRFAGGLVSGTARDAHRSAGCLALRVTLLRHADDARRCWSGHRSSRSADNRRRQGPPAPQCSSA